MVEVGDRIKIESVKVGQAERRGTVVGSSGPMLRIRWDDGPESLLKPGAGALRVIGREEEKARHSESARDLAVAFLRRAAEVKDQEASEATADPVRLLAETDALTESANMFRDLPDDHPAVAGLDSMLIKVGGNETAFLKDFARMVHTQTGVYVSLERFMANHS
jgi:hypothetical protein